MARHRCRPAAAPFFGICNPRPALTNPNRPHMQCPDCGAWHQVNYGGQVVRLVCHCGAEVWRAARHQPPVRADHVQVVVPAWARGLD